MFEHNNIQNQTILRDVFIFWTWQHLKRSNSARRRQFLSLTTSKKKQFCETSFKNGKLSAELTASYQCFLRFFQSTYLKYCACHEKLMPGHTKCCTCHATPLRKSVPWPPNVSHEHVFCTAPATENASLQILFKCPMPAIVFGNATKPSRFAHFWQGAQSLAPATRNDIWTSKSDPHLVCFAHFDLEMCHNGVHFFDISSAKSGPHLVFCTFWLGNVLRATTACTFSTSQLPKVVRTWCVFRILTWKCPSRHNGVHFFDISSAKSGPHLVCFAHFDLEMCFAPQRRALFPQLNFQKWSERGVFSTFWLGNVLRATTACTFSTSQVPKVVRTWFVLYILTWKCASRHNGVQFFISRLAWWLRTRRFSELTFRSPKSLEKRSVSRLSYLFAHLHLLSSDSFSSLIFSLLIFLFSLPLPCSAFHLSILSEVWQLNFLRI